MKQVQKICNYSPEAPKQSSILKGWHWLTDLDHSILPYPNKYLIVYIVIIQSSIHYKISIITFFQEFLLADKNMSVTPVAFSLMASFMSAITLLGVSSENYTYGAQFIVINISYGIFTPVAAYLYLPVFFKLQATSAYEVGIVIKTLVNLILLLKQNLIDGLNSRRLCCICIFYFEMVYCKFLWTSDR